MTENVNKSNKRNLIQIITQHNISCDMLDNLTVTWTVELMKETKRT